MPPPIRGWRRRCDTPGPHLISLINFTFLSLEYIMLSERSQTQKDKYCMISLICGL
jgi:hypothetical protein